MTGAGISTESGIPDFRGPDGIWTKNPQAERDAYLAYPKFQADPKGYWKDRLQPDNFLWRTFMEGLAKAKPNRGHLALAELEQMGIIKCILTQNVDGLHSRAGSRDVVEYHGGMDKLRCMKCGSRFPLAEFDVDRMAAEDRLPPRCPSCRGVLKEDGVSFGEPIPRDVMERSEEEARTCDVMLICGTSAVVVPFAYLPRIARQMRNPVRGARGTSCSEYVPHATIIEVNAEPTPLTSEGVVDYSIYGMTGDILPQIVEQVKKLKT
ncbi:MAG: NAD-dependent deacylase [Chloroflexi bacterium]|nr:NAD-dependent deacylase [Chloroflexota bacterium]